MNRPARAISIASNPSASPKCATIWISFGRRRSAISKVASKNRISEASMPAISRAAPILFVRKEITVETSQTRAFNVVTQEHGALWPLATNHIGGAPAETAIIEPRAGGRWFERAADGTECDWGRVRVWDPPGRLVLSWQISASWKHDPALDTEVEVRFVALGPALTRVELEHRRLENFGADAEKMRATFDSDGAWIGLLRECAAHARA